MLSTVPNGEPQFWALKNGVIPATSVDGDNTGYDDVDGDKNWT